MNIFEFNNYRDLLRNAVDSRKAIDSTQTFQWLAQQIRVPKSYISKVLGGTANLSQDQVWLVSKALGFADYEHQFLSLLVEYERSGVEPRKKELRREIDVIRNSKLTTASHIEAEAMSTSGTGDDEYYLDPWHQIVHICLSIDRFGKSPQTLASTLGLSKRKLSKILSNLEKWGIVRESDGTYSNTIRNVHLAPGSPTYDAWRSRLKLLALQRLESLPADDTYSFSAVFSTSERNRVRIQKMILSTLSKIEKETQNGPIEKAYQLSIDLFPWS